MDDPVRHRAQLVLLAGVDLADGRLRSRGALKQRRLLIEICVVLRRAAVGLCLCEAGAMVRHVEVTCRKTGRDHSSRTGNIDLHSTCIPNAGENNSAASTSFLKIFNFVPENFPISAIAKSSGRGRRLTLQCSPQTSERSSS